MLKYQKIANDIRQEIMQGDYLPGEQLLLEKEMCAQYKVSRITIKRALDELVGQGLVVKRRGAGTFVKTLDNQDVKELSLAHQFSGFAETYQASKVDTRCIRFEIVNPEAEVAAKLQMTTEDFIYDIIRVRYVDDTPIVIEYTKMPIQRISGMRQEVLLHSIYAYIEGTLHLKIQSAHHTVRAVVATEKEQDYLQMTGLPVLEVEQVAFLDDGRPFEYSISHHRADKSAFKAISIR